MPLDPRAQRLLRMVAAAPPRDSSPPTLAERRDTLDALMALGRRPFDDVEVAAGSVPGAAGPLATRLYRPSGAASRGAGLIYFHGGGLVAGSLDSHDTVARALAQAGACRVIAVDYRLAPEHRFPAALDDAVAATRHLCDNGETLGVDAGRLGLCGDSAGGALAAAACQWVSAERRLAVLLLLCPILDYALESASRRDFAQGYLVEEAQWRYDLGLALPPGMPLDDPRLSPLHASLPPVMPRTLIHTAEYDPMRDDGLAYRDRLLRHGTDVSYTCHPGMIHLFYGLGALIPHADTAFEQIGGQIRQALA